MLIIGLTIWLASIALAWLDSLIMDSIPPVHHAITHALLASEDLIQIATHVIHFVPSAILSVVRAILDFSNQGGCVLPARSLVSLVAQFPLIVHLVHPPVISPIISAFVLTDTSRTDCYASYVM